jgi:hypothetical protein
MTRGLVRNLAVAVLLVSAARPAGATTLLRSLTLAETTQAADRIVLATVSDVRVGTDGAGLPATWITLDVQRAVKGRHDARTTIKQLGDCDAASANTIQRIPDLPRYSVGEEVIVFLRRDSARGFTSPVGFGDGVFRVTAGGNRRSVGSGTHHGEDVEQLLSKIAELVAAQARP